MTGQDEGDALRLMPVYGSGLAVVVWGALWLDIGAVEAGSVISGPWSMPGPGLAPRLTLALLALVGFALVSALGLVVRRQRRLAAALRDRDAELAETRERLRRHVADLERIGDVASHDLQEPLRRMVAYAQLLEDHERCRGDGEVGLYVSQVVDGARRMKALVGALRAFVSTDSVAPAAEGTAAAEAVMVARKRLANELAGVDAALILDPLPEVLADQASLVEIFLQLIDNAIRFRARDRHPVIHVSARCDQAMARFVVRDNGIGIPAERVTRMFEIFYRPHDAGQASSGGIGMGLAVVRRLVERLGGEVWVESEPGKGSSFGFSLPLDPSGTPKGMDQEALAA